jgi:hypothetical protein
MDVETFKRLLRYDSTTGQLIWRFRPREMFANDGAFAAWNAKHACKIAGHVFTAQKSNKQYVSVRMGGKAYRAHRVICAIFLGLEDHQEVDHRNGDGTDNRLENLRVVDRPTNNMNIRQQARNSTGVTGVCLHRTGKTFGAFIIRRRQREWLGSFDNIFDAAAARKSAEIRYGFGPSHGTPM